MALKGGGCCSSSPRNRGRHCSISRRVGVFPDWRMISPSPSKVRVGIPKRTVASYSLVVAERYWPGRGAAPRHKTSTPEARGSRVPAWPTLRMPVPLRTMATTWCDVGPTGLSTMMRPKSFTPLLVLAPGAPRAWVARRERRRQPGDVQAVARAPTHFDLAPTLFDEDQRDLGPLDRSQHVDQVGVVRSAIARRQPVFQSQAGPDQRGAALEAVQAGAPIAGGGEGPAGGQQRAGR